MSNFIVEHVDALISFAVGVFALWFALRPPKHKTSSEPKPTTGGNAQGFLLRLCGLLAIGFGILRIAASPTPQLEWERILTKDRRASAEFPGSPQLQEKTATFNGMQQHATSLLYRIPNKNINLFLTFSPIVEDQLQVSDEQMTQSLKVLQSQGGFSLVAEERVNLGAAVGTRLEFKHEERGERVRICVAVVDKKTYRVVAGSGSHHDDPIIHRFLESFRIEERN